MRAPALAVSPTTVTVAETTPRLLSSSTITFVLASGSGGKRGPMSLPSPSQAANTVTIEAAIRSRRRRASVMRLMLAWRYAYFPRRVPL